MHAPRDRAPKTVNGVTEHRPPLMIHNLGVFRQTINAATENSRGPRELRALRSGRPARSRPADLNLLV